MVFKSKEKGKHIVHFHMTSRRPYWCFKTMKRRPCWSPRQILWELNTFLMQTLYFVSINLHRCWSREWKRSFGRFHLRHQQLCIYCDKIKRLHKKRVFKILAGWVWDTNMADVIWWEMAVINKEQTNVTSEILVNKVSWRLFLSF